MGARLTLACLLVAAGMIWDTSMAVSAGEGDDPYAKERDRMVDRQLANRDISDPLVLAAMRKVPRHRFVPEELWGSAYGDYPLPIGHDQTISQPYVVAFMTQAVKLKGGERCLEVGTGSGYGAAVLSAICGEVCTIEILCPLAEQAEKTLGEEGFSNVTVRCGDGYQGWEEHAPFDAVVVTAAADHVPKPLIRQLKQGGRLVMPVGGSWAQDLMLLTKMGAGVVEKSLLPVRFVPLTGPLKETGPDEKGTK